jgi:hypothetical protein
VKWQTARATDYAQLSADGRYSVARIRIMGDQFYEAWRTRSHPDGPHMIRTNLPTSQAARDAAEEDDRE